MSAILEKEHPPRFQPNDGNDAEIDPLANNLATNNEMIVDRRKLKPHNHSSLESVKITLTSLSFLRFGGSDSLLAVSCRVDSPKD